MKTAANNKKIREIITLVKEGKVIPRPEFQRRLVWSREDKNKFIDTILRGFPFPEIYLADGEVNLETGAGTQLLVDGLQRVNTIFQYFSGDRELKLLNIPAYEQLCKEDKQNFLQYDVAVRDLGNVSKDQIIEVFKRLNATKYSLLDIEISNAVYAGELKKFADSFSSNPFFENHVVFNAADYKRMGDLRYCLTIVITLIVGYFNRDDEFEDILERYNDDFPLKEDISSRIDNVINFIEECGFEKNSRVWRKADLFTLFIELDNILNVKEVNLQPGDVLSSIDTFFKGINSQDGNLSYSQNVYYKAALQATNDRLNRIRRGIIMNGVLMNDSIEVIDDKIRNEGIL